MKPVLLSVVVALAACAQPARQARQAIGSACVTDEACGSGPSFYCATDHPSGYCEAACNRDSDCPTGAVCVGGGLLTKGDCHQSCGADSVAPCRASEGYACVSSKDASHAYCDPPGRSDVARRARGRAWRW